MLLGNSSQARTQCGWISKTTHYLWLRPTTSHVDIQPVSFLVVVDNVLTFKYLRWYLLWENFSIHPNLSPLLKTHWRQIPTMTLKLPKKSSPREYGSNHTASINRLNILPNGLLIWQLSIVMCILSINNKQHLCSNLRKIHNSAYLVCRWRCGDFNIQRAALWKKPLFNISDSSIYHWQTDSNCILKITFLAFFLLPIIDYNSKKLLVDKNKSNKIPTKKKLQVTNSVILTGMGHHKIMLL